MAAEQDALMAAAACWRCVPEGSLGAIAIYQGVAWENSGEPPVPELGWQFGQPAEDWVFGDPGTGDTFGNP